MRKRVDDILNAESSQELSAEKLAMMSQQVSSFVCANSKESQDHGQECQRCAHALMLQYGEEPIFCLCQLYNNQQAPGNWCKDFRKAHRQPKLMKRLRYVTDVYNK